MCICVWLYVCYVHVLCMRMYLCVVVVVVLCVCLFVCVTYVCVTHACVSLMCVSRMCILLVCVIVTMYFTYVCLNCLYFTYFVSPICVCHCVCHCECAHHLLSAYFIHQHEVVVCVSVMCGCRCVHDAYMCVTDVRPLICVSIVFVAE